MDTVHEEVFTTSSETVNLEEPDSICTSISQPPTITISNDLIDSEIQRLSVCSRPTSIITTLRRPSQTLTLSTAQVIMNQKQLVMEIIQKNDDSNPRENIPSKKSRINKTIGDDALTTQLSALYAKLLVVLGIAFPITEIISLKVPSTFYQGFYLYLYSSSVLFVVFMYTTLLREKAVFSLLNSIHNRERQTQTPTKKEHVPIVRYGSFYLRLGAIAFGIGSMVYSGLEFGQYFELKKESHCNNVLIALTPAARTILTIVQMQFIFLNGKQMELNRYKIAARFGMMHMIATNMCEWLYVLVEETRHEIIHIENHFHYNSTDFTSNSLLSSISNHVGTKTISHQDIYECKRTNIMGSLVQNASPFLFPCTIEYSLICAVILYEMWKNIKNTNSTKKDKVVTSSCKNTKSRNNSMTTEKIHMYLSSFFGHHRPRSSHHFSVDCAGAHRGLFAGIIIIVFTIISLIMFFVLNDDPLLATTAILEVTICELTLYVVTLIAVVIAMFQIRSLKYFKKGEGHNLGLDTTLLVMAQTGVFIYCMFSIIGSYFTLYDPEGTGTAGLVAEIFSLIQTIFQTMFVLDGWWRRCRSPEQARRKPGRQTVTFLLIANMAMWTINSLEKNRAQFKPTHLKFFGVWAWTIITHVSMPMSIFYRFHSTICLFEIWKTCYKMKWNYQQPELQKL